MENFEQLKPVSFSYRFIVVDYLLRWLALGLYNYLIPYEQTDTVHKIAFVSVQILIAVFTCISVLVHEYEYYKYENNIEKDEGFGEKLSNSLKVINEERHYVIQQNLLSVILRSFFVISVSYMLIVVFVKRRNMMWEESAYGMAMSGLFTMAAYGLLVGYVSSFSVSFPATAKQAEPKKAKPIPKKQVLEKQEHSIQKPLPEMAAAELKPETPAPKPKKEVAKPVQSAAAHIGTDIPHEVDDNDIALIDMEGKVHNYALRIQEYALEAVIFCGLCVTGFLIATASGKMDFALLKVFGTSINNLAKDIITMDFKGFGEYALFNLSAENILFLMMLLSLYTAMTFIMVLVSRIKFNDLIEDIDNAIRKARNYNDKEEQIFLLQLQHESGTLQAEQAELISNRLAELSLKIQVQIEKADTYTHEVESVLAYITFFRKAGIFLFLLIILAGLMLFDPTIAEFFGFMGVLVYFYRYFDDASRARRLAKWRNA
jgi:hypothetical protein